MKFIHHCLSTIPLKNPMIVGGLCLFNIFVIVFSILLQVWPYSSFDKTVILSLVCLNGALNICFTLYFISESSREFERQLAGARAEVEKAHAGSKSKLDPPLADEVENAERIRALFPFAQTSLNSDNIRIMVAEDESGPAIRPLKALIVEDQELNSRMIGRMLTSFGMEPYFAKDGVECIEVMEEHPDLDLILLDLRMPRMDGWTVARKIRNGEAGENFSKIPIAVVSGEIQSEESFRQMGVDDFIHKPFDASQIRTFVNKVGVERMALAG